MAPRPAAAVDGRLASVDAFRGLDILVMVFVNYLAGMKGIPGILLHAPKGVDGFTIADVVFPCFLFIVGVSIPLAFRRRLEGGASVWTLARHVASRAAALALLGLVLVNRERFSPELVGLSKQWWTLLVHVAIFAAWAVCPKEAGPLRRLIQGWVQVAGLGLLAVLLWIYRGVGPDGVVTGIQPLWWGILGVIGWAYLGAALVYLAVRGDRVLIMGGMALALALYVGDRHQAWDALTAVRWWLPVGQVFGSKMAIVLAGVLAGLCVSGGDPARATVWARARFLLLLGGGLLAAGLLVRPVHGISKIAGTDAFALVTTGLSCLIFLGMYLLVDVAGLRRYARWLEPAGTNPLLAYLLPGLIGPALGLLGIWSWAFPWFGLGGWWGAANAVLATAAILGLTAWCGRLGLVLKL